MEMEPNGTERGESSIQQAHPILEVALAQLELIQPTDHHPCTALQTILEKFEQTNLSIDTTVREWSN